MTRCQIIKRTWQYLFAHIGCIVWVGAVLALICYKSYKVTELQKDSLILIIPMFVINMRFYYRYLYDVMNKNIYEATIIPLYEEGKNGTVDILARVLEGTTVGKNKRKLLLKPRRKSDYVFKKRGTIPGYDWNSTVKIKYLKFTKLILESEVIEEKTRWLFEYNKKEKDYLLSPKQFYIKNPPYTMEEAKELTKQGNVEHIAYTFKERVSRFIGGIVYSMLAGALIFVLENLLILLLQSDK